VIGTETKTETVALALGSNMGDRLAVLRAVVAALPPYVMVEAASGVYETPPVYVADQPAFLNAALLGVTHLEPLTLLWALKHIEADLGRQPTFRYGPRLIDIDIVFYGERRVATPELTLPHPRLAEREFVLRPLADIAGGWRHPETGLTVDAMLAKLPDRAARLLQDRL
jgi:2-amino-4-hydroxy-6-hydroxymethyldihydropteridine diphosphokinase